MASVRAPDGELTPGRPGWAAAAAFLLTGGGVLLVALDGGSYDIVVRQRLAVVLWWVLALAVLVGLVPRRRPHLAALTVLGGLAALGVWTAASLGWTSSDERTLVEVARVAAHLGVVVLLVGTLGPSTWRFALAGASAAAAAVCVVALGSRLAPDVFGEDVAAAAFSHRRLSEPFAYWNAVGAWAGMTSALCLGWSAHVRAWWLRAAALAVLPVAVVVSYLTYSRASLGGTVLGLLVVLALSRNRWTALVHVLVGLGAGAAVIAVTRGEEAIARGDSTEGAGSVLVAVLVAAAITGLCAALTGRFGLDDVRLAPRVAQRTALAGAAVALVVLPVGGAVFGPDAWESFRTNENVVSDDPAARLTNLQGSRSLLWSIALDQVAETPLKGVGAGTFENVWNARGTSPEFIRDGHSLYLEVLTELGVVGLLLLLVVVGGALTGVVHAVRRADTAAQRGAVAAATGATAAFFFGAGVDWLWESTGVAVLALVVLSCLLVAAAPAGGRPSRARVPFRVLGAGLAVLLVLLQLPGLVSTSEVRRSQDAVKRNDLDAARAHASQALDAQPWAASPLVQRALVAERRGELRAAIQDLSRAAAREPKEWRTPLLLARVRARAGDADGAIAAYRQARALRPRAQFFRRP